MVPRQIWCGWQGACLWLPVQLAIAFWCAAPPQMRSQVFSWQQPTAPKQILAVAKNAKSDRQDSNEDSKDESNDDNNDDSNICGHHPGCEDRFRLANA